MNKHSKIFEEAFRSFLHGCVGECSCGKVYYDASDNYYNWEDGEFERLEKDPNSYPLPYAVTSIMIGGEEIVPDCDCGKLKKYEDFIIHHAEQIAKYLNMRSKALSKESASIKVRDNQEIEADA